MIGRAIAVALVLLMTANSASAQPSAAPAPQLPEQDVPPLLPDDVLRNANATFPEILAALEREVAADGKRLEAEGAFDIVFNSDAFSRVTGFWSGSVLEVGARRPLQGNAGALYGGYRLSQGRFPVYEDQYFTNSLGEVKVGAIFSLLRGRRIDDRRFGREDAALARRQASIDTLATRIGVQFEALRAYWFWVAAAQELTVFEDLVVIAEARDVGFQRQFQLGALPAVALVENQQSILQRRRNVVEAERRLEIAANDLAFFLRNGTGALQAPRRSHVPRDTRLPPVPDMPAVFAPESNDLFMRRPELRDLRIAMDRTRNEIELRNDDLRPQLDLGVELSRDFGNIAEGGASRDSTDTIVGFSLTVPLERSVAKGRIVQAEAELRELELTERLTQDKIQIELEKILVDFRTAKDLVRLTREEAQQAERLVEAERKRFFLGAGDFFLVNVREEQAADVRIQVIRAELAARLASASYEAATMDLDALGISEEDTFIP